MPLSVSERSPGQRSMDIGREGATDVIDLVVVEDSLEDQGAYKRYLTRSAPAGRYWFRMFSEGEAALAACADSPPSCILLDFYLPDMCADDYLRQLRILPNCRQVPVVVLTGQGDEVTAVRAMKAGAVDYIPKDGLTVETMSLAVRYALERAASSALRDELERAQQMAAIGRLAAGVAHEINNPAAFILANLSSTTKLVSELAESSGKEEEFSRALAELADMTQDSLDGIRRISTIVAELASMSRLDPAKIELASLNDVVETAVKLMRNQIEQRCRLTIELGRIPEIVCDRGKLVQVAVNLLDNAVKAIAPGDVDGNEIRIETARRDDRVVLLVRDTGCGIRPEQLGEVFTPFFTSRRTDGLGLGLSLSAESVRLLGGRVSLRSELGEGTVAVVSLPLDTSLTPDAKPEPRPTGTNSGGKVLIVDDEAHVLSAFRRLLSRDYEVVTAQTCIDALQLLSQQRDFVAIVCDFNIPDVNGLELYKKLAEVAPELQKHFAFCTGGGLSAAACEFLRNTTIPVLPKPAEPGALRSLISDLALGSKQAHVE